MKSRLLLMTLLCLTMPPAVVQAGVDTLKGTIAIEDGVIYSWAGCNAEVTGEDCRRYNAGGITNLGVGMSAIAEERRTLMRFPGWDGLAPDSSKLLLYCKAETDNVDRKVLLYPLTKGTYEGTEAAYNIGDYPNPDSGATWNHAWLDDGDDDSLNWTTPGGDYNSNVACTMTVTDTGQYL
ncbi:MAG: hypothetical protein AB1744_12670, partial [Candidatus Zixiibacteriota bacterium]